VLYSNNVIRARKETGQLVRDYHGPVLSARAADRDGEIRLALTDILRNAELCQVKELLQQRFGEGV